MTGSGPGADIAAVVHQFLDKYVANGSGRPVPDVKGWDPALMSGLTELGWPDLTRSAERNGLGIPLAEVCDLAQLVGERLVPGPLAEQLVLPALLDVPAESLLALADPAITEDWSADAGHVLRSGDRLDGTVELVRYGGQADHLVVVAATADGDPVLALLPTADRSVTVTELRSADPAARYARVTVRDRQLEHHEVLAEGPPADALLTPVRAWSRLLASCELSGIASRVLADTVAFAGQRVQFGRPIGSFQAVKHIIAGMAQGTHALDALCAAAADEFATAGSGSGAGAEGAAVAHDVDVELTGWTVKAYAARTARAVCEDALQVHGGIGFTAEHDLHRYLGRALALRSWYGDERELIPLIGARRLAGGAAA